MVSALGIECCRCMTWASFRPIGVLNRFTQLRHSKVKYKIIFHKALSPPSPSSSLKLPINAFKTKVVFSYFRTLPLLPLLKHMKNIHTPSVHQIFHRRSTDSCVPCISRWWNISTSYTSGLYSAKLTCGLLQRFVDLRVSNSSVLFVDWEPRFVSMNDKCGNIYL